MCFVTHCVPAMLQSSSGITASSVVFCYMYRALLQMIWCPVTHMYMPGQLPHMAHVSIFEAEVSSRLKLAS